MIVVTLGDRGAQIVEPFANRRSREFEKAMHHPAPRQMAGYMSGQRLEFRDRLYVTAAVAA